MSSPLIKAEEAPDTVSRERPSPGISLTVGLIATIVAGLLLSLAYGQFYSASASSVGNLRINGNELGVRLGRAASIGDAVQVQGLESRGNRHALLTRRVRLNAEEFTHLRYVIDDHHPSVEIFFVWLRADDPGGVYYGPLGRRKDGAGYINLGETAGWEGEIIGVGINVVGTSEEHLPTIRSLTLSPASAAGELGVAWSGWTRMNSWLPSSINIVRIPEDLRSVALAPAMAAWSAIALGILAALQLFGGRFKPGPGGFLTAMVLPWIAFDVFWQARLNDQLVQTRADFSGKSHHERRLAEPYAGIYRYAEYLKKQV